MHEAARICPVIIFFNTIDIPSFLYKKRDRFFCLENIWNYIWVQKVFNKIFGSKNFKSCNYFFHSKLMLEQQRSFFIFIFMVLHEMCQIEWTSFFFHLQLSCPKANFEPLRRGSLVNLILIAAFDLANSDDMI